MCLKRTKFDNKIYQQYSVYFEDIYQKCKWKQKIFATTVNSWTEKFIYLSRSNTLTGGK